MKYKCVNNLEKFCFQDATLHKCEMSEGLMTWKASGIIIRHNNPSNETLVDRYIDTTEVRFKNPIVSKFLLEGEKYYDANNVLMNEIPDTIIDPAEYPKYFKMLQEGQMFIVNCKPSEVEGTFCCEVAVDLVDEEEETTDTYWFELVYDKVVLEWEHFQNKATVE